MQLFACYHKQYPVWKSDVVKPIHVGKEIATVDLGLIGDNTGDNVSFKNPYFCELTATYWIWKKCQSNIVGLSHYRRFFNLLTPETVAYMHIIIGMHGGIKHLKSVKPMLIKWIDVLPRQVIQNNRFIGNRERKFLKRLSSGKTLWFLFYKYLPERPLKFLRRFLSSIHIFQEG
jgi:hypothetical protein